MHQPLSGTSSARSPGSPDGSDTSPCLRTPSVAGSPFPSGSRNTEAVSPAHTGQRGKGPSHVGGWWRAWRRATGRVSARRRSRSCPTTRSLSPEPMRKPRVRAGRGRSLTWERRRLLALGRLLRGPGGCALSPSPLPAAAHRLVLRAATCMRRQAALTLCHGTAIRQASQINSGPVQENRQLSARDNAAFVLRLQVQGQLPVLHCGRQGDTEKETKQSPLRMPAVMEDGSTTPALPWDRTSASWSPPGLPTPPEDNVPAPSGPAVSANAIGIGPTPTHTHQHHQGTPGQPHRQLPRKTLLHQPLLAKRGPSTGMELPWAATQLRPRLPTDPEAGAVRGIAAGKLRDSTGLTWHTGQEGSCMRMTTGRLLGHEAV